jgi:hypothetical protein
MQEWRYHGFHTAASSIESVVIANTDCDILELDLSLAKMLNCYARILASRTSASALTKPRV